MSVTVKQAVGMSKKEAEERAAAAAARLLTLGLRPEDTIRFPKVAAASAWVTGHPLDINADGSVSCFAHGLLRAIRPERIQVKMRGPRGGVNWEQLVPEVPDA